MTHLLRTELAKRPTRAAAAAGSGALRMPDSTDKLKKHITTVCDRLALLAEGRLRPAGGDGGGGGGGGGGDRGPA